LRDQFPGKIDQIFYDVQLSPTYCWRTCALMRIGFEDENWRFPPITMVKEGDVWHKETTCFERILVPSNTKQHFTSRAAAERHRNQALKFCNIPHRYPTLPKNIFFFQRGHDRQIYNGKELCESVNDTSLHSDLETDDHPDFCTQVANMYAADVIVSVDGSHNQLLSYARPGSVLILVLPYNFRVPDWKLLAYYVGLRTLEIITLDPKYSLDVSGRTGEKYIRSMLDGYKFEHRVALKGRNTLVPSTTFNKFLKRAMEIWNKQDSPDACEIPSTWPVPIGADRELPKGKHFGLYSAYGYENNYHVCEPPAPDCLCCESKDCQEGSNLERGF